MPDFIRPNYHVVLVHFPLALLTLGILIELFSFMWRRSMFRVVGRWMILIGALTAIPTALSGIYAMWDVTSHRGTTNWPDTLALNNLNDAQWQLLRTHVRLALGGVGIVLLGVMIWLTASDRWRKTLYFPTLLVLLAGVGMVIASAQYSGNMVWVDRVAVEPSSDPALTVHPAFAQTQNDPANSGREKFDRYVNVMQIHMIGAGLVAALSLLAIALSLRGAHRELDNPFQEQLAEPPPADPMAPIPVHDDPNARFAAAIRPPDYQTAAVPPPLPASRFALLGTLLALITAAGGLYIAGVVNWDNFQDDIIRGGGGTRDVAHAIGAGCIVVLTILLALVARVATRQRFIIAIFSVILLAAIAFQLWIGTVILLDSPTGPLLHLNQPTAPKTLSVPTSLPAI